MESVKLILPLFLLFINIIFIKSAKDEISPNGTKSEVLPNYDYNSPTYYDYYEYNENLAELKFKKCFCEGDQLWNNTHCIPMTEDQVNNVTSILINASGLAVRLNKSVATHNTKCHGVEMLLNDSSFYFLNNKEIYHINSDLIFGMHSYCFEFIGNDKIFKKIVARACLPHPELPICCQIPSKCSKTISTEVTIGGLRYLMKTDKLRYMNDFECAVGEIKHKASFELNNTEVSIVIVSGETHLLWNSPTSFNVPIVINNNKYCIENKGVTQIAHFCYRDPVMDEINACKKTTCVRKCCPDGFLYGKNRKKCVTTNKTTWSPSFIDPSTMSSSFPDSFSMLYGYPWCSNNGLYQLDGDSESNNHFNLFTDGKLYDPLSNKSIEYSKFCVENFLEDDLSTKLKALVCFESSSKSNYIEKCEEVHGILYPTLIVVSCAFLFITLVVYASVPELYANLHGKSLLSHVTSLLIAYVCQVIISWSAKTLSMVGCKLIALGTQISFLWAFFWLNVMCCDIWWTLKSMSPSPESGESSRRRFMLYSVYAWGCPLLIGLVTAIMEFLPQLDSNPSIIVPGFGVRGCWFQDVKSTWLYFHGFTLLLYVLNIFFFFHVAAILIISQRLTEGILRITRKQYKERVFLYLKLFVVMGITWICEVASWQEGTCEYWMFTDIINSLQGLFLFLIFMCNKKVFQKIHAKASPIVRYVKSAFKSEPRRISPTRNMSNISQRTTQTSIESSGRRLSSSSLNGPGVEMSLKIVGEVNKCDVEKNKFY